MNELKVLFLIYALFLNWGYVHSKLLNSVTDFLHINSSNLQSFLHPPTFPELAAQYGHPAETYQVTTKDGYILTLFRLPGNGTAPPVLLCHGILDSADTWIIRGNASLSISLVKRNHDVWLANFRGNKYSKHHKYLNADDPDFWNFTFHEIATRDLPVLIDCVLNKTDAKHLNYIGHSQGTSLIYALLATKTEYNAKVNVAIALAPKCYVKHILPPFSTLLQIIDLLYPFLRTVGITSIFTDKSLERIAFGVIAQIPVLGYFLDVTSFLFLLFGADPQELEPKFLPTAGIHFPTGNSIKDLVHYAQIARSDRFARYDHGVEGNLAAYNSTIPPVYELANIKSKMVLLAALNDKVSQLADVDRLYRALPNVLHYEINSRTLMNHIDHVWGRTAYNYLYHYIYEAIENYN